MFENVSTGDLIEIILALGIIFAFIFRLGPRIDSIEKWQNEHQKWANETAKAHTVFEVSMARLADSQASTQDWLKITDQRLIDHISSSRWDSKTERRRD